MEHLEVFLVALFVSVALLNAVASWLNLPYPIVLVVGGLALALVPGVPTIVLEPDLVLTIFLPPLLYSAAFFSDLRALRQDVRAISLTAIGLVILTAAAVAVAAHEVMGMSWAMSFALGAIVAPTDPVAATALMRRVGAPRRIVNIIEGESLINDASALVIYRTAVAAAVGGSFSLIGASLEFVGAVAGGIAIGLAVGFVITEIRRRLDDVPTEITISLLTGYAAFLPAEELGLSGVLAAVTAGIYLGWHAPEIASPQMRLQGFAVWEILVFILNATLFILIGLQLPVAVEGIEGLSAVQVTGYAALVTAVAIACRFLWVFTVPYLIRFADRRPQQRERRTGPRARIVVAWSGMRGAVTLAAALALPLTTDAGEALPERELIQFIAFAVILITVVGQGLTLPALIRRLGVVDDGSELEREEVEARLRAVDAAIERLEELAHEEWVRADTVQRVRGMLEFRLRRFTARADEGDDGSIEERSRAYQELMRELYRAQRQALAEMHRAGEISTEVMRDVVREIDLEESRLEL
jgi:monovalent cation/hydrogen antiporter